MSRGRVKQEASVEKTPSARAFFYGSIGLLLAGVLLLAIGAFYSLPALVWMGLFGWLGAGVTFLSWLQRKVG